MRVSLGDLTNSLMPLRQTGTIDLGISKKSDPTYVSPGIPSTVGVTLGPIGEDDIIRVPNEPQFSMASVGVLAAIAALGYFLFK